MEHPCRASRDPLKGAAPAVRQSRHGGALGGGGSLDHPRRASAQRGFTLIELLVAISVLALLAVLSWRSLDGMQRTQAHTQQRADQLLRLQAALGQWNADLDAITDTQEVPVLDFNGQLLRLTRRDSSDTALSSSGVRVVAWTRHSGATSGPWMRWQSGPIKQRDELALAWQRATAWSQGSALSPSDLDLGDSAVPVVDIETWTLFYHRGQTWGNPLSSVGNEEAGAAKPALGPLPNGVRLVLTLSPTQGLSGTLVRDWVRPTLTPNDT